MRAAILLLAALLAVPGAVRAEEQAEGDSGWWHADDSDWWADPDPQWWHGPEDPAAEEPGSDAQPGDDAHRAALQPEAAPEGSGGGDGAAADGRGRRGRNECARLPRQIQRYKQVDLALARERGNAVWEQSTEAQIARLEARFKQRCAEPDDGAAFARVVRTLAKLGRLALTAARLGLL